MSEPPSVLGRQEELDELRRARGPIALVGPGGIGKSTLARLLLEERGGTWVDASSARDVEALLSALAGALGTALGRGDPLEKVATALEQHAGWVAVDNLEQVQGVEPVVQAWSDAGIERLILTSRFPVPARTVAALEPLTAEHAAELFSQRAAAVAPGRDHPPEDVERLLELLGGNPLAIELAAGHTGLGSARQIADRIAAGRPVADLSGTRPDRHRDLTALVRTSVELLPDDERDLLQRAAVFAGPFELYDAEEVLGPEAVALLDKLRRKFLIAARPTPHGTELGLAPEVRQAVRDVAPPPEETRRAHAVWTAAFADRQVRILREGLVPEAMARLERVHRELIEALDHEPPGPLAARIARHLCDGTLAAWSTPQQQLAFLEPVLDAEGPWYPERAALVPSWAQAQRQLGRQREGTTRLELELERAEGAGHASTVVALKASLSNALIRGGGSRERAMELARSAAESARGGDPDLEAGALRILGLCLRLTPGCEPEAAETYRRAIRLSDAQGDRRGEVFARSQLLFLEDDPDAALATANRAIAVADALGDPRIRLVAHLNALHALADVGEWEQVQPLFERTLAFLESQGQKTELLRARARVTLAQTLSRSRSQDLEQRLWDLLDRARDHQANGEEPWLLSGLGFLAHLDGRLDAAAERYETARSRAVALNLQASVQVPSVLRLILGLERGENVQARIEALPPLERAWIEAWQAAVADGSDQAMAAVPRERLAARWYLAAGERSRGVDWLVASDGSWFSVGGDRVGLGRRRAPKRLLAALAQAREQTPGEALDGEALFAIGWPGQTVQPESAKARLYVAIRDLRKLGLEPILQTHLDGYRLDPATALRRVEPNS